MTERSLGVKGIIGQPFFGRMTGGDPLFRLGIYLKYSFLFKKEVKKKEGMKFGVTDKDLLKESLTGNRSQ